MSDFAETKHFVPSTNTTFTVSMAFWLKNRLNLDIGLNSSRTNIVCRVSGMTNITRVSACQAMCIVLRVHPTYRVGSSDSNTTTSPGFNLCTDTPVRFALT